MTCILEGSFGSRGSYISDMGLRSTLVLWLLSCAPFVFHLPVAADPAQLPAQQIMAKVAQNQDREQKARASFVYEETVHVATRYTNGKLAREEYREFIVTPKPKGLDRKCVSVKGRYRYKGRYIDYSSDPIPEKDSLDAGLTSGMQESLEDNTSKDSLGKDLFPLTTEAQKDLTFKLVGEQTVEGRPAYRIGFGPKDRGDLTWAGEALIDKEEFQPVSVYTRLSRRLPFYVRTMLGTDLPGVGFNVRYVRVDKDVWFPVSFGTEFRLRAVFFINRNISVSMENKDFRRATAESQIHYENAPPN